MFIIYLLILGGVHGISVNVTSQTVETKRCSDGYVRFEDSCYLLNNEISSWIEAQQMCILFDGSLIEVDSPEEYTFIQGYLNEHGQQEGKQIHQFTRRDQYGNRYKLDYDSYAGYWMGGHSMELPGHWFWSKSKQKVDFNIIGSSSINITESSCLSFDKANLFQARNKACHTQMYSICEKAPYTE
ncbi:C-type lectin domain family 7 member A-like [Saccostrea echinata]|uniref:C-type lectin domain family 7 member A-like n=1 Tax=Saccostrea echinata TaxID=191078 RepID=UPI002A7F8C23|nr:C-type lectin domain family 7 member A-like [Saccostrea echinata]